MDYSVSIIVPVYNAESTLEKCLDSIFKQTLDNIELILVDDGSVDSSPAICDRLAHEHDNVCVLHCKNGGPSAARNAGIPSARGKYTAFVDSDDIVRPDMFERLFSEAERSGADVVFCDYYKTNGSHEEALKTYPGPSRSFSEEEIKELIIPYFFGYADSELSRYRSFCPIADNRSYIWACLYATGLIAPGIRFKDEKLYYNEDNLFNLDVFLSARKASYLSIPLYEYFVGGPSFTGSFTPDYGSCKTRKYEYLLNNAPEYLHDAEKRIINKAAVEVCTVVNYYAGAPIKFGEKKRAVSAYLAEPFISNAIKSTNFSCMPQGREKIYLSLIKHGCSSLLLAAASMYKAYLKRRAKALSF